MYDSQARNSFIAGHVVMIVDGALDIRCKDSIQTPLLYTDLNAFFSEGTGYNVTFAYDVSAMWDSLDQRFVLWAMDRESGGPLLQTYFVAAVSKTADPTDGWSFVIVDTQTPYTHCENLACSRSSYNLYSINDSPTLGFTSSHLYVTDSVLDIGNTSRSDFLDPGSLSQTLGDTSDSLWAFPKRIAGGLSVYQGDVLPARESVHYERFDLRRVLETGLYGAVPTRIVPSKNGTTSGDTLWLVAVTSYRIQRLAGRQCHSWRRQASSRNLVLWRSVPQNFALLGKLKFS